MKVDCPRHEVEQLVSIRDVIFSRYAGLTGRIVSVHEHGRGTHTLDKYTVAFAKGEQEVFWDIQLEALDEPSCEVMQPAADATHP
jgi:hypothetical protein